MFVGKTTSVKSSHFMQPAVKACCSQATSPKLSKELHDFQQKAIDIINKNFFFYSGGCPVEVCPGYSKIHPVMKLLSTDLEKVRQKTCDFEKGVQKEEFSELSSDLLSIRKEIMTIIDKNFKHEGIYPGEHDPEYDKVMELVSICTSDLPPIAKKMEDLAFPKKLADEIYSIHTAIRGFLVENSRLLHNGWHPGECESKNLTVAISNWRNDLVHVESKVRNLELELAETKWELAAIKEWINYLKTNRD